MNEFYSIKLDKEKGTPIYQQLGDALYILIENGVLKPDSKLPPIRKMADALKINNVTVVNAYKYLENKKAVYSHIGSGTYVSSALAPHQPIIRQNTADADTPSRYDLSGTINFADSSTPAGLFPTEEFKRYTNQILETDAGNAFYHDDPMGYETLRQTISTYLGYAGIKASPEKLQIVSGFQHAMDILAKTTLSGESTVIIENPSNYGSLAAFTKKGWRLVGIDMESDGINIAKLEEGLRVYHPSFICVTTCFQSPTGICYSPAKKRRLLELAARYGAYIIEMDSLSELNFSNRDITPLKNLDYKNIVIYVKNFRQLIPGLHLGFMLTPKKIAQRVSHNSYGESVAATGLAQKALDLFIQEGGIKKQADKMNSFYQPLWMLMNDLINRFLGQFVIYNKPEGGFYYWLGIKSRLSIPELSDRLAGSGVIITPGEVFSVYGGDLSHIRLSITSMDKRKVEKGIGIIGDTLNKYQ